MLKYVTLRDKGVISEEEFEKKKNNFNANITPSKKLYYTKNYSTKTGVIEIHQNDVSKIMGGDKVYINGFLCSDTYIFTENIGYYSIDVSDGDITSIRNKQ